MNSTVRINVRATFGDAAKQFATLIAEMDRMDMAARKASAGVGMLDQRLDRSTATIGAWGKKLQYASSILTYNFTLPIVGAFGLLTRSEMQYERQLANLSQVYGDVNAATVDVVANNKALARDYAALDGIIITLSSHFGINRTEVAAVATELGRAGVSGLSLAEDTQTVVTVMRAFGISAHDAAQGLLQLRVSYGLTSKQALDATGVIAVAAQATRADFEGLTAGIIRAAPPAIQLGVDVRHLAAMLGVMAQAGFKGGESGNALSTAFQRLTVITPKAADVFKKLGIDANGAAFQSLNAAQRFELLGEKYKGVSRDAQLYATSVIFGVRQQSKLSALLTDVISQTGTYGKILDETSDQTRVNAYLQDQLAKQLKNPAVAFDVLKQTMLNNLRVVGMQLLPALSMLMGVLVSLTGAFANLSPPVQEMVIFGLVTLALVGPVGKVIGSFGVLFGFIQTGLRKIAPLFGMVSAAQAAAAAEQAAIAEESAIAQNEILAAQLAGQRQEIALYNAYVLQSQAKRDAALVAGNGVLAYEMRQEMAIFAAAAEGLTAEVAAAEAEMMAVTSRTTAAASTGMMASMIRFAGIGIALAVLVGVAYKFRDQFLQAFVQIAEGLGYIVHTIYSLLQWLNPFARHSPSLVENTENGTQAMSRSWSNMSASVARDMAFIQRVIKSLNEQMGKMGLDGGVSFSINKGQQAVQKQGDPGAISAYKQGIEALKILNGMIARNQSEQDAQTEAVKRAKKAYDDAGDAIKAAQHNLKDLESQQKAMQKAVDKMGNPAALRSQATAASNMGRALLEAGNPELAAQFGEQAKKLSLQADKAQEAQSAVDRLSDEIDRQRDAIDNMSEARDNLLATYDAEKDKLDGLKAQYSDLTDLVRQITDDLRAMAQAATAANSAAAAAKGAAGKDKNPGFGGALDSTMQGLGGSFKNDAGDLNKYLDDLKASLGTKLGAAFPDPTKGISDFMGKLKDGFKKGWDDFERGAFEDAFGFGKGLPEQVQGGLAIGIGILGAFAAGAMLRVLGYLLSGKYLMDALRFGRGLILGIAEGAEGVGLAERLGGLARGAVGALLRGFLTLGGALGRVILTALAEVAFVILDFGWVETGLEIVAGIVAGVAALPAELVALIALALVAVGIALYKWHDDIFDFGKKLPGWIWDGLTAAWDATWTFVSFVAGWLSGHVGDWIKALGDWGKKLPGMLFDGLKTAWEKGFYLIGFIIGWLAVKAVDAAVAFGEWAAKIPGWLWSGLKAAWDKAWPLVQHIGSWLAEKNEAVRDKVDTWARHFPGWLWGGITAAWDKGTDLAGQVYRWVVAEGPQVKDHLISFGKKLPGWIWSGVKEIWDLVKWLGDIIKYAVTHLPNVMWDAVEEVGKNIARGIKAGLENLAWLPVTAVKGVVHGIIDGANRAAGNQSPSKEGKKVGAFIAQGIALGIQSQDAYAMRMAALHVDSIFDQIQAQAQARGENLTLPPLTQRVDLQYNGQPGMNGPSSGTLPVQQQSGPASGGGDVHLHLTEQPTVADPMAVAAAMAWSMRTRGY